MEGETTPTRVAQGDPDSEAQPLASNAIAATPNSARKRSSG